jgi:hypothetical protein
VELVAGVHADDNQFGLAAKRPVALPQRLLVPAVQALRFETREPRGVESRNRCEFRHPTGVHLRHVKVALGIAPHPVGTIQHWPTASQQCSIRRQHLSRGAWSVT